MTCPPGVVAPGAVTPGAEMPPGVVAPGAEMPPGAPAPPVAPPATPPDAPPAAPPAAPPPAPAGPFPANAVALAIIIKTERVAIIRFLVMTVPSAVDRPTDASHVPKSY